MPRILKRPQAEADLIDIWLFIAKDNIPNADVYLRRIEKTIHLLADKPLIGRRRDELGSGIRCFPVGHHVVFYYVIDQGIDVLRLLHGMRDFEPNF